MAFLQGRCSKQKNECTVYKARNIYLCHTGILSPFDHFEHVVRNQKWKIQFILIHLKKKRFFIFLSRFVLQSWQKVLISHKKIFRLILLCLSKNAESDANFESVEKVVKKFLWKMLFAWECRNNVPYFFTFSTVYPNKSSQPFIFLRVNLFVTFPADSSSP